MSDSKKLFTFGEIEILSFNPYTLSFTSKTIRFTVVFKQTFWMNRQTGERLQVYTAFLDMTPAYSGCQNKNNCQQHPQGGTFQGRPQ